MQPKTAVSKSDDAWSFSVEVRQSIGVVTQGDGSDKTPIHSALGLMADYLTDNAGDALPDAHFSFPDPYSRKMVEVSVTNLDG